MTLRSLAAKFDVSIELIRSKSEFVLGKQYMDIEEDNFFKRLPLVNKLKLILLTSNLCLSGLFGVYSIIFEYEGLTKALIKCKIFRKSKKINIFILSSLQTSDMRLTVVSFYSFDVFGSDATETNL